MDFFYIIIFNKVFKFHSLPMRTFASSLNRANRGAGTPMPATGKSAVVDALLATFRSAFNANFSLTGAGYSIFDNQVKYSVDQDKKGLTRRAGWEQDRNTYSDSDVLSLLGTTDNSLGRSKYENIYHIDKTVIDRMNWYNFNPIKVSVPMSSGSKVDGEYQKDYIDIDVVHSLFNPYFGIAAKGPYKGLKLTPETESPYESLENSISNCTVNNLVRLSRKPTSILGNAKYKYADFMYCKELGMPNNHLITLRRFAIPVGDNIYYNMRATESDRNMNSGPDIGRMLCYFGGEDNKLEDILSFSFSSSYEEMKSSIEQLKSQEDDKESFLGSILNTMSPDYNKNVLQSTAGGNNVIDWIINKIPQGVNSPWYKDNAVALGENYDKHKVYEPKNTIRSMHVYNGELTFKHDFTLTFSYKLRGYDNINPKVAMLDLIGNILTTTYNKGSFWGGKSEILGAQPNVSGWNKANKMIDGAFDEMGEFISGLGNGTTDLSAILGNISNFCGQIVGNLTDSAKEIIEGGFAGVSDKLLQVIKKYGIQDSVKGSLKNILGRPQIYQFQSLLTGDNTGMWHVTIGNPLNPIACIGNLFVSDVKMQTLGPLGLDDFPTELKVTVSLSHARPRDSVNIQKMFTKGGMSIYIPMLSGVENTFYRSAELKKGTDNDYTGTDDFEFIKKNCEQLV